MPSRALSSAQESRVQSLISRHAALDIELEEARKAPSINDIYLSQLKKQKLRTKDEIDRIHASG